jgi:hypothetical protein
MAKWSHVGTQGKRSIRHLLPTQTGRGKVYYKDCGASTQRCSWGVRHLFETAVWWATERQKEAHLAGLAPTRKAILARFVALAAL